MVETNTLAQFVMWENYGGYIGYIDENFAKRGVREVQECLKKQSLRVKYKNTTLELINDKVVEVPKKNYENVKSSRGYESSTEDFSR